MVQSLLTPILDETLRKGRQYSAFVVVSRKNYSFSIIFNTTTCLPEDVALKLMVLVEVAQEYFALLVAGSIVVLCLVYNKMRCLWVLSSDWHASEKKSFDARKQN